MQVVCFLASDTASVDALLPRPALLGVNPLGALLLHQATASGAALLLQAQLVAAAAAAAMQHNPAAANTANQKHTSQSSLDNFTEKLSIAPNSPVYADPVILEDHVPKANKFNETQTCNEMMPVNSIWQEGETTSSIKFSAVPVIRDPDPDRLDVFSSTEYGSEEKIPVAASATSMVKYN